MKYIGFGDIVFSLTLAYFFTWNGALNLESWGWCEAGILMASFCLNFLVVALLLYLVTRWQRQPIFGQSKAYYFPLRITLPIAMAGSALMGLIKYVGDDLPMTRLHLTIYIVGYILGVIALLLCFYFLTKKHK